MDNFRPGTGSTAVEANAARKTRTIPAWIASWEKDYGPLPPDAQHVAPNRPPQIARPDHNHAPAPPQRRVSRDGFVDWDTDGALKKKQRRRVQRGRKWDHLRSSEPVIIPNYLMRDAQSPWRTFVQASRYGHMPNERSEVVDSEKLDELMPGFNDMSSPRLPDPPQKRRSKRAALHEQVWRLLLNHPLVPAFLRLTVLITSVVSLALAGNLWKLYSGKVANYAGGPEATLRSQWIVAIVVDCVVLPYVVFTTRDEYTGPQIGLRSPMHKVTLTLLDLFFIIFKSASTTLAFDSLYIKGDPVGQRQKMEALASFLLLGLISWILNFTVNVFRLVQRLGPGGERETRRPTRLV